MITRLWIWCVFWFLVFGFFLKEGLARPEEEREGKGDGDGGGRNDTQIIYTKYDGMPAELNPQSALS